MNWGRLNPIRKAGLRTVVVVLAVEAVAIGAVCWHRLSKRSATVETPAPVRTADDEGDGVRPLAGEFPMPEWRRRIEAAQRTRLTSASNGMTTAVHPVATSSVQRAVTPREADGQRPPDPVRPEPPPAPEVTIELVGGNGTLKGRLLEDTPKTVTLELRKGVRAVIPKKQVKSGNGGET